MNTRNIYIQHFKTSFGELTIGDFDNNICLCDWRYREMRKDIDQRIKSGLGAEFIEENTPAIKNTILQLHEYLNGERKVFDISVIMTGTDFQKSVWKELMDVPYGKTVSYQDIARKINNEKSIRAVAAANGANALSIIIPCHRVVGSDGSLTGYAGGLEAKRKLLELESLNPAVKQLDLFGMKD